MEATAIGNKLGGMQRVLCRYTHAPELLVKCTKPQKNLEFSVASPQKASTQHENVERRANKMLDFINESDR